MPADYPLTVTENGTLFCVAPGCVHKPAEAEARIRKAHGNTPTPRYAVKGTDLCEWHHARFPLILGDLVTIWKDLEQAVVRRTPASLGDRVQTTNNNGLAAQSSFWNPSAASALYDLTDWAGFLVRTILNERPIPTDEIVEDDHGRTITTYTHGMDGHEHPRLALAAIARYHARWLSAYPTLGPSLLQDALDLRNAGRHALDAQPVKRVGIRGHKCQEVLEEDEIFTYTCGGDLVAIVPPDGSPRPIAIMCVKNPAHQQLPKERWMEYSRAG